MKELKKVLLMLVLILAIGVTAVPTQAADTHYVENNKLYSPSGKLVKKLPVKDDHSYGYETGYKGKVYLTRASFHQWRYWTYMYDTKTKKLTRILNGSKITGRYGKYVTTQDEYVSDVSGFGTSLYQIKSDGTLKKIKTLATYGQQTVFVDGKLYYTKYTDKGLKKGYLYRANPDGSGAKKLLTVSSSEQYGQAVIHSITSKNCKVSKNGKTYLYTYSTKKLKQI